MGTYLAMFGFRFLQGYGKSSDQRILSCLYEAQVIHTRITRYRTSFSYRIFTFFLDLDELDFLSKKFIWFRRNRFSLYSYYDADHLFWNGNTTKESILNYLRSQGMNQEVGKIFLLTNLRVLGYVFNPVSFYFVFSPEGKPLTAIAEVGNTFGERKPYYFGNTPQKPVGFDFRLVTEKLFYVSPFISLDSRFDFRLCIPGETLKIQVDSYENGEKTLGTAYLGKKKEFCTKNLLFCFLKYPFVTVKIIGAIHYRALVLFLRKLPYLKKKENPEKQIGVQLGKND